MSAIQLRPFSLLCKPVSAECNLACQYCFYRRVEKIYPGSHLMSDEVLEAVIKQFLGLGLAQSVFSWQGGEPTLAGLDFFQKVVRLQEKLGRGGQAVGNALQTNGILIDDDWARFLAKYNFLVGVSLDGPKEIHNKFRRSKGGQGSFDRVMAGISALRRHNVAFNILTLVTSANERRGRKVYRFLRENGSNFLQFIPCVEKAPNGDSLASFSVTPERYGEFLCELFDEWVKDYPKVSIRLFDSLLEYHLYGRMPLCVLGSSCDGYLLIEHNGDVYPCDFFVQKKWRLGNLLEEDLLSTFNSPRRGGFSKMKALVLEGCEGCQWRPVCYGGCLKDRERCGDPLKVPSPLCPGYRKFFEHTKDFFKSLRRGHLKSAT